MAKQQNEMIFNGKNKTDYYIDDVNNSIFKTTPKGEKKLLTYNDLSKMYLDLAGVKLDDTQTKKIKKFLIDHPFTTFFFCSFPKEKIDPNFDVNQIVEHLSKHSGKLLSTYASSILFLQTEGISYNDLIKYATDSNNESEAWNKFPEEIRTIACSFCNYYNLGYKTFAFFPKLEYNKFLKLNKAVYRNSSSVEQTLKLINLSVDSSLYTKTEDIWAMYMQGKNSQLSFKDVFPILNLTCTYSLYKMNYKDKNFENLIKGNIEYWNKHKDNSLSSQNKLLTEPHGLKLVKAILEQKVNTNTGLNGQDEIRQYFINTFDLENYVKNEEAEREKLIKWFMKNENSNNRDLYSVQASELIKHNVEHSINNALWLIDNYNKELQFKPIIPQELQKFVTSNLARNAQTPKIYEQIKTLLADKELKEENKVNILKFFHILNKNAIKTFKSEDSKKINLPDVFSRYFSSFVGYFNGDSEKSTLNEISKYFIQLMDRKDELPTWVLKGAFNNSNSGNNYGRHSSSLYDLKDNINQLDQIATFLEKSDRDLCKMAYETNARSSSIREYVDKLVIEKIPPQALTYVDGSEYDVYNFFKDLKLDPKDPDFENKLHIEVGKFIIKYSGLDADIDKIRAVKSIRNVKAEDLGDYTALTRSIQTKSFESILQEKHAQLKTTNTYMLQLKQGLSGEKLAQELQKQKNKPLDHNKQVIYEDENYTCFIPTPNDIRTWAHKMHNCMENCYLPRFKNGSGLFLYICKKGQFDEPLNATYIKPANHDDYSYGWGDEYRDNGYVAKQIAKNLAFNESTKNKKSKNFGQKPVGLLHGFICTECKNNGRSMYNQPNIYALESYDGKYKLQTPEEREHLHNFTLELRKRFGFDGSGYFEDFDRKMEEYYRNKKQAIKAR